MRTFVGSSNPSHRFSPPPELSRSAPRDVRLTAGGVALLGVAWVCVAGAIAGGLALNAEARRQAGNAAEMERRGIVAVAEIDRLWRKTGDGKPAYAAFHFDASGRRVNGETRMRLERWRALRPGATLPVRYLPEQPADWVLDGSRGGRLPQWVSYVVASSLIGVALLCGAAIRRERTLLAEGRAARAVITKVSRHHSGHGASHRVMHYEFPLLGGGQATGKSHSSRKPQPEAGAAIHVVYDPDRPARNQPYPFSLVKVDTSGFG